MTNTSPDPRQYAAAEPVDVAKLAQSIHPPRHRHGERFVAGPLPVTWLRKAAVLRGKALAVGLALWFMAGMTKRRLVKGTNGLWLELGIGRKSAYAGLAALEKAGLVAVERHSGRSPMVTILTVNDEESVG